MNRALVRGGVTHLLDLVVGPRRTVSIALRDDTRARHLQFAEEGFHRRTGEPMRTTIEIPIAALDDTLAALAEIRAVIVGELGAGATQRRDAQPWGTWSPPGHAAQERSTASASTRAPSDTTEPRTGLQAGESGRGE